jgi:hypothetical protein
MRKKFARTDVWTMDELVRLVDDAATSSAVPINANSGTFKSFKGMLTEAIRNIPGIRKYQVFSMLKKLPGRVYCCVGPDDEPVEFDLRRVYDGVKVDGPRVEVLFEEAVTAMRPSKPNTKKIVQMHQNVHPCMPDEYRNDVLYAPPTEREVKEARTIKQVRTARRKNKHATKPTAPEADEHTTSNTGQVKFPTFEAYTTFSEEPMWIIWELSIIWL